jgi:phosphonopyruvate decarboxylase
MLDTRRLGHSLQNLGYRFFSGIPCSFLKPLINDSINHSNYVMASNEGDAVAACAGAHLAGVKSVFLCQNSGLANAVSPLTSLNAPFRIPVLGFVSLRGEPGIQDEPQHELMGEITAELLDTMRIQWDYLSRDEAEALEQFKKADSLIASNQPFFFVVRKNTFSEEELEKNPAHHIKAPILRTKTLADEFPTRLETLKTLVKTKKENTVFLATTGKTGRELYEIEDSENHLYMVGSMGCISSLGLGLALNKPQVKTVVLDGDGSLLMRLGNLPAIGYYQPSNLLHILLDNGCHDSTGGQFTVSATANFVEIAAASGYAKSIHAHNLEELEKYYRDWSKNPALTFLRIKIAPGSKKELGRPKIKPHEVKNRLMDYLRRLQ